VVIYCMQTTTPESRQAVMGAFTASIETNICYLAGRWQDEKEYEDFKDYADHMKELCRTHLPTSIFIKGNKRPFGFNVKVEGFPYTCQVFLKGNQFGWTAIN